MMNCNKTEVILITNPQMMRSSNQTQNKFKKIFMSKITLNHNEIKNKLNYYQISDIRHERKNNNNYTKLILNKI